MLLGLNFQVEGSFAIKALLRFFYPNYEDMIDEMDANNFESIQHVLKRTTENQIIALQENMKKLGILKDRILTPVKERGTRILKLEEQPDDLVYDVTEFGLVQTMDKRCGILIEMFVATRTFDSIGDDDFKIDIRHHTITSYDQKIATFHLNDLNLPIGFNNREISTQTVHRLDDEALILLALNLSPVYRLDFITIDYIDQARKLCYKKGLLDQDDVDYLTDERNFLLSGAQYEHPSPR